MVMDRSVGVLVGSLRKESFSRRLAGVLRDVAPANLHLSVIEIGALPHYNQDADDEGRPFEEWLGFRQAIHAADAILFVTPEYNRSIPGVLKNAIDVGSRPYGQSAWDGKPAAVVSNTPGMMGGFGANHALRQPCVYLNMPVMQQPEAYIGGASSLFSPDGGIVPADTQDFLCNYMVRFADWIETILGGASSQSAPSVR